jgi:FkbM family methyltransferase
VRAFPGVQVHAFEPLPENFAALQSATAGQGVRVVNAAVSDLTGTVTITRGQTTQHASLHRHDGGQASEVPAETIDEYMSEHGLDRVDLLKIDAEGHEEAVLRGGLRQLKNGSVDFVLCECDFTPRPGKPHGDFRTIFALLEPLGCRVVSFYTGGVDSNGWVWGDVLFCYAPGRPAPDSSPPSPRRRALIGLLEDAARRPQDISADRADDDDAVDSGS